MNIRRTITVVAILCASVVALGGGMVVGQATEAFWLFTGVQPDERRMRRHFLAGLAETDAPELVPASVH